MTATLVDNRIESLGGLDFRPSCVCDGGSWCGHGDRDECGAEASVILTMHWFNFCDGDGCDPDGNHVGPACAHCVDTLTAVASAYIEQIRKVARQHGGHNACKTCGAPLMHVSDIIRSVVPI